MQGNVSTNTVHTASLTLIRDQITQPIALWQNDQCFKLRFDSPYKESSLYDPFDTANPPVCAVSLLDLNLPNLNYAIYPDSDSEIQIFSDSLIILADHTPELRRRNKLPHW